MKIIKALIILLILLTFLIGLSPKSITIGKLWANLHVNSLIGFQKLIENIFNSSNNSNLWGNLIIPILEVKILFFISIMLIIIFIII